MGCSDRYDIAYGSYEPEKPLMRISFEFSAPSGRDTSERAASLLRAKEKIQKIINHLEVEAQMVMHIHNTRMHDRNWANDFEMKSEILDYTQPKDIAERLREIDNKKSS